MTKDGFDWGAFCVGIIAAIVALVLISSAYGEISFQGLNSQQPINIQLPNQSMGSNRPDIAAVFLPYVAATDLQTQCSLHQGQWVSGHDSLGCYNMVIPMNVSVCGSPTYLASMQQCTAIGATSLCNTNNLGCHY